jgi:hypothetical protein
VIGRKNYLFAGAESGRERAAAIYSLIGIAKLNDLDPQAYLGFWLNSAQAMRALLSANATAETFLLRLPWASASTTMQLPQCDPEGW